jgi:hypothetical protein
MKRIHWMAVFVVGLALALAALYIGTTWYLEKEAAAEISDLVKNSHIIREFGYQRLRVSPLDRVITLSDVSSRLAFTEDPVRMDRIRMKTRNETSGSEIHEIMVTGIHLPAGHSGLREIRPILTEMGYNAVEGNLECRVSRNSVENRVSLEKVVFEVIEAGRLEIALDMRGISAAGLEKAAHSPLAALAELQHAAVGFARIVYRDHSLFSRLIEAYARLMNVPPASVTNEMVQKIDQDLQTAPTPSIREALETLKQFVIHPEYIQVVSAPPQPVSLRDAFLTALSGGPETWMDLFHVRVTLSESTGATVYRVPGQ